MTVEIKFTTHVPLLTKLPGTRGLFEFIYSSVSHCTTCTLLATQKETEKRSKTTLLRRCYSQFLGKSLSSNTEDGLQGNCLHQKQRSKKETHGCEQDFPTGRFRSISPLKELFGNIFLLN